MRIIKQLKTATDYWHEMVEPDYRECLNNPSDLRAAFHAAISLFHMHDWIWVTYASVRTSFTFTDGTGATIKVHDEKSFANALEQQCADFGRVRGIATGAKHLQIKNVRPVQNAPRHVANIQIRRIGGYFGRFYGNYFGRYYGHATIVVLEGTNGNDMKFSEVARAVYEMWGKLRTIHGWCG